VVADAEIAASGYLGGVLDAMGHAFAGGRDRGRRTGRLASGRPPWIDYVVETVSGRYAARSARIAFDDFERAAISSYTSSMSASDRGEWIVTP
jgi:hypothetical protein